jgi:glycine cleavage system T protein (aminomethyltransferase)
MTEDLRRTPLEAEHMALRAKLGPFGGWLLPIEYAGTLAEHAAVRERVGLFDVSHLGKVEVSGPTALEVLQRTLTNDVSRVAVGAAQYGMALNDRGGIVDDLIVYRTGEERYLVVPNAANVDRVRERLAAGAPEARAVAVRDDLALIAVQGPRSPDVVGPLFPEAEPLTYMHCAVSSWEGEPLVVARTGYTGERGYELFVPVPVAADVWRRVLEQGSDAGIEPCGLAARDTLRLEMGYPLHGNDIDEDHTPVEAGLTWAVAMGKGEFPGRGAVERQIAEGPSRRLVGLRMQDRLIPRSHYGVFAGDDRVGETSSGTFSPTLRIGIALAYVSPSHSEPGRKVGVDVRGRRGSAEVVRPPFLDRSPR